MKSPLRPYKGLLKLIGLAGTIALATPAFAQTPAAAPVVDPTALGGRRLGLDLGEHGNEAYPDFTTRS